MATDKTSRDARFHVMQLFTIFVILILIGSLGIRQGVAKEDSFPYLTNGQVFISEDFRGHNIRDDQTLNGTDYYYVQSNFINNDTETKSFSQVYFAVMVVDQDDIAHVADLNTYGDQVWSESESSLFSLLWDPQLPGNYTIRTFLISGLDAPQILTSAATLDATVIEKIDKLGEGEANYRLHVDKIDTSNNTVSIVYNFCDERHPYTHKTKATLGVGDHVSINAADAYFLMLEDGKALFKFVSNGGSDICLV